LTLISRPQILRDRSLFSLFAARTVSLVGSAMAPVALAFAILDLPGGNATTLGLVLMAGVTAQVVFVLLGGVIADRFPRHRVMVSADLVAGLAQAAIAALVVTRHANPGVLAALVAVSGAATALFTPASRSVMPQLVTGEALQSANALLQVSIRGGTILGTALAGVFVAAIGPGPTLFVNSGSFFLSAVLLGGIKLRYPMPQQPAGTVLRQLRDGWVEFTARSWVWLMVAQLAFVNILLSGGFFVLGPVVSKQSLGGAPAWAAILTAQAIGFVVGSATAVRLRPRYPVRTAALLTMGFPFPLLLLAARAPVAAIAATAFITGLCIDLYGVLFDTALQKHTPAESLSRLMSYESMGSMALVPVGAALIGPVSQAVGIGRTLVGEAVLILLAGPTVLLAASVRGVRDEPAAAVDQPVGVG
jgi:predicted MFS family arabinose efflux permease